MQGVLKGVELISVDFCAGSTTIYVHCRLLAGREMRTHSIETSFDQ